MRAISDSHENVRLMDPGVNFAVLGEERPMLLLKCALALFCVIKSCLGGAVADFWELPIVEIAMTIQEGHKAQQQLERQDARLAGSSPKPKFSKAQSGTRGRRMQLPSDTECLQYAKGGVHAQRMTCDPGYVRVVLVGNATLISAYTEVATLHWDRVIKRYALIGQEACVEAGFTGLLFTSPGVGLQFQAIDSLSPRPQGAFMVAKVGLPKFKIA